MRMQVASIAMLTSLLAGCGLAAQAEYRQKVTALKQQSDEAQAACRAKPLVSYIERAKCLNEAAEIARPIASNPDLLNLMLATRLEIAARVDRKEITPEQGALEYAKAQSEATSEGERRTLAARSVAAQQATATALADLRQQSVPEAKSWAGVAAHALAGSASAYGAAPPPPPADTSFGGFGHTNCTTFDDNLSCRSY